MGEDLDFIELRIRLTGEEVGIWDKLKSRFGLRTNTELLRLLITDKIRQIDNGGAIL